MCVAYTKLHGEDRALGCWEWRQGDISCGGGQGRGDGVGDVGVMVRKSCVRKWCK